MLDIPLPAFHMCAMDAPLWTEWAYVAGVGICGEYQPHRRNPRISLVLDDQTWQLLLA